MSFVSPVFEVHREQAGRVAVAAVLEVERLAGLVEAGGAAGHRVFGAEFEEVFPLAAVAFAFGHLPDLAAGAACS